MSFDKIFPAIAGVCCIGMGLKLRKKQNKNWKAMLVMGIALLIFVVLAFIFGWQM